MEQPEGQDSGGGFGHMVMDDAEEIIHPPEPAKPDTSPQDMFNQRLNLDSLPEHMRGKSIGEIVQRQIALEESLRISERARESMTQIATQPQAAPAPIQQAPPEMTREQLQEWMQTDPIAAIDFVINKRGNELVQHIERRFAPLTQGATSAGENYAKQKYAKEFELYGDQINQFARSLPNQDVLANPRGWDDMISYIRGLPGNIDKYVDAQIASRNGSSADEARKVQAASTGFTATSGSRPSSAAPGPTFTDPVKAEIARVQGISYGDYIKWEKMG